MNNLLAVIDIWGFQSITFMRTGYFVLVVTMTMMASEAQGTVVVIGLMIGVDEP